MQATPMTRRQVLTATAGAVGTAMIGSRPRRSYARQEAVTLRWWDYYSQGANNAATQNQLQRYMDAHPNVTIEREAIPFADLKQKLLQGAAAGDLPDIAVIDNPDHQAFAALGILEDLTDRVTEWGQADAYFAGPWDSTIWQERNYGIPDNSNCLVLWSNTAFTEPVEVAAPANVTVVQSAPHSEVLEHAAAMVTHAGHGSVVKALAAGVPLVMLPFGRDQNDVAARAAHAGAGVRLKPTASAAKIAAAVRAVLDQPAYGLAARRAAATIAQEREQDAAADALEALDGNRGSTMPALRARAAISVAPTRP